jgi:phage baseplate assembly protein V
MSATNLCRVGKVSKINGANGTVQVAFSDKDNLVSHELPVLFRKTKNDKDYWMPDVGEHVLCLFLASGLEQGFVVGAFYSATDAPPTTDPEKTVLQWKDGTKIEVDRKNKEIKINAAGKININVEGDTNLVCKGKTMIDSTGEATVKSAAKVIIDAPLAEIAGATGGLVTGECICAFTGAPHSDFSAKAKAGKV